MENTRAQSKDDFKTIVDKKPPVTIKMGEDDVRIISEEQENLLEDGISNLLDFMENNDGVDKNEEEKDELFKEGKDMLQTLYENYNESNYLYPVDTATAKFMYNQFKHKMTFTGESVFYAVTVKDIMDSFKNPKGEPFVVSRIEGSLIYHLFYNHTISGFTGDSYNFIQALTVGSQINELSNYYEGWLKHLQGLLFDWVSLFDSNVTKENTSKKEENSESDNTTVSEDSEETLSNA